MADNKYWVLEEGKELANAIINKVDELGNSTLRGVQRSRAKKATRYYYGESNNGSLSSAILPSGERGELSVARVNLLRFLAQQTLSIVTGQRIAYKTLAKNNDVRSREQSILANGLLAGYAKDLNLDRLMWKAAENALITSEGWVRVIWDHSKGEEYVVDDNGVVQYEGDISVDVFSYFDVFRDESVPNKRPNWLIVREWKNKYDLAAQYPEYAKEIVSLQNDAWRTYNDVYQFSGIWQSDEWIPVYTMYHERTPAVPDGKETVIVSNNIVLTTGPLPFDHIPLVQVAPAHITNTNSGYTPVFDVLSLCEALDRMYSTILTNNVTFGVQHIATPRGNNIEAAQLSGGLSLIEYDLAPPTALNLTATSPESFNFFTMNRELLTMLMGHTSASLGLVEQRLSGTALAALDQKAYQFASAFQQSYQFAVEDVGNAIISILRQYASTPRIGRLIGKDQRYMLKSFDGSDLEDVDRIVIETVNPAMLSYAARAEMADKLLSAQLIKTPNEYFDLMVNGQIDTMTNQALNANLLISRENESMMTGQHVAALATDDHTSHILKHRTLLDDPDLRRDPVLVEVVLSHIGEHIELLRTVDPELLMVLGQQPSQLNQQMMAQNRANVDPMAADQTQETIDENQME